jgi:hypothetical protein
MKKEATALVLASVLASPVTMAKISMAASGKGKSGTVAAAAVGTSTKMELEAELRFRDAATNTRAEAEVEVGQKTKNGVISSKLEVEFEITQLLPAGGTPSDPTGIDADISVGGVMCTISDLRDPSVKQVVRGAQIFQKVSFHGSFAQVTPAPATPLPDKGLNCTGDLSTIMLNAPVKVAVTGLGTADIVFPDGKLKLDD